MIPQIKEIHIPLNEKGVKSATLESARISLPHMGEKVISANVRTDGEAVPNFSEDWEIEFRGERYIMPIGKPQGLTDNGSIDLEFELEFIHWAIHQMKNSLFFTFPPADSGTAVADEFEASVSLNLKDFRTLVNRVMDYYFNGAIYVLLCDDCTLGEDTESISISNSYIWDVILKFHEIFAVEWYIECIGYSDEHPHGIYAIKVGFPTETIDHKFTNDSEGGLIRLQRQVQDRNIHNVIYGRGGDKNLPPRYFKKPEGEASDFMDDPDWIPELESIYFTRLRGATFRSYVQGWNHRHYRRTEVTSADMAYAPWAWMRGYTDDKFRPVEFVADGFTIDDNGYGVEKGSSIERYGKLMAGLNANDGIYPTIQGTGMDRVVGVLNPADDNEVSGDSQVSNLPKLTYQLNNLASGDQRTVRMRSTEPALVVPEGQYGWLDFTVSVLRAVEGSTAVEVSTAEIIDSQSVRVVNAATNEVHSASGIPEGSWYYEFDAVIRNTTVRTLNLEIGCEAPWLTTGNAETPQKNRWYIWVQDIWDSNKIPQVSDNALSELVWGPILGGRLGGDAKVLFTSGLLGTSEDYEFQILGMPEVDRSIRFDGMDSFWKIELGLCDADLEATNMYLPNKTRFAKPGDRFVFLGITMPHKYVLEAEKRLDDWKKDELGKVKDIHPALALGMNKVRIFNCGESGALIDELQPGRRMKVYDKRLIGDGGMTVQTIQSITISYQAPTANNANLLPDVDISLSDEYVGNSNPVSQLSGEVSALQRQIGSIGNIERLMIAAGDKRYLRKDGQPDTSATPTEFTGMVTGDNFRPGIAGGRSWGFYQDLNGRWGLELDWLNVRHTMQINSLVINQIMARGGMTVESCAQSEITKVQYMGNAGIKCFFDTKGGTVANLWRRGDIAWSSRFTPQNNELKVYRRMVTSTGTDYVVLAENGVGFYINGQEVYPATGDRPTEGDTIVQFGSYMDAARRFAKINDVMGGGYTRYLEGIDSVESDGHEYYFVGKIDGSDPRLFIGDLAKDYFNYSNGKIQTNCELSINSRIGDKTLPDHLKGYDYLTEALANDTKINGGLIQTSVLQLGEKKGDNYEVMAGSSGLYGSNRAIASWWGGKMIDMEVEPANPDAASALVRMDGSGYFSGNTIRFEQDYIMVGDNIRLDYSGLSMLNESGTKFMLTNGSIGDFDPSQAQSKVGLQTTTSKLNGWLQLSDGVIETGGFSSATMDLARGINRGDILNMDFMASIYASLVGEDGKIGASYTSLYIRIRETTTGKDVYSRYLPMRVHNDVTLRASEKISLEIKTGGTYVLIVEQIGGGTEPQGATQVSCNIQIDGFFQRAGSDMLKIGNDGIAMSFDQTKMFVNKKGAYLSSGDVIMRVTASGVEINESGGAGAWRKL